MAALGSAQTGLSLSAGFYVPTNGAIRDAFGSSIFHFGFGGSAPTRTGNLQMGTQLDFITASKNGNRLFMAPLTYNVEQQLTMDPNATVKPYVKGFAGIAYIDYGISVGIDRFESRVFRPTFGGELGIVLSDHLRVSARYNFFSKADGFDFSGLTVGATFGF